MRNVRRLFFINNRGVSLIQLMVAVALGAVVSLAVINMMGFSTKEQKRVQLRDELLKLKNGFSEILQQNQAIQNTINASVNTNMACLRNRTACAAANVASTYSPSLDRVVIYNSGTNGGEIFYDGRATSTAGFTEKGTKCTGFSISGAGNDLCPVGFITTWYVNQTASTSGLTLTLNAKMVFNPSDSHPLKTFINAKGTDTKIGPYDVVISRRVQSLADLNVVTCDQSGITISHSGSYIFYATSSVPTGSRCQQEARVCSVVNDIANLSGSYTNPTCVQNCSGQWSLCSATCGGGTETYTVNVPANQWGAACPFADGATRACNTAACTPPPSSAVDCVGGWGAWSTCSASCGGGTQTRTFSITTPAANGGAACVAANGQTDSQTCNPQSCGAPVDCVGNWTPCGANGTTTTYVVTTPAANGGAACSIPAGATAVCSCNCYCGGWSCSYPYSGNGLHSGATTQAACSSANGQPYGGCTPSGCQWVGGPGCSSSGGGGGPSAPVNCVGSWSSTCDASGYKTYTVTTPAANGGTACPVANGAKSCSGCTSGGRRCCGNTWSSAPPATPSIFCGCGNSPEWWPAHLPSGC